MKFENPITRMTEKITKFIQNPENTDKYVAGANKMLKLLGKGVLAIGSMVLIGKINDELGTYGVHVGYNSNGGITIDNNRNGNRQNQSNQQQKKPLKPGQFTYNDSSVAQKSIVEMMYAAESSYSHQTKLNAAKRIFDIAIDADDDTQIVAINALSRLSKSSYSCELRDYATNAIAHLGICASEDRHDADCVATEKEKNAGKEDADQSEKPDPSTNEQGGNGHD